MGVFEDLGSNAKGAFSLPGRLMGGKGTLTVTDNYFLLKCHLNAEMALQ